MYWLRNKKIGFLLNPLCIKFVTIHLSACNFAIIYLYKKIKLNQKLRETIFLITMSYIWWCQTDKSVWMGYND